MMDKPKVRYLDVVPLDNARFILRDPYGVSETLVVPAQLLLVMMLMDGTRTEKEIREEFFNRTGLILSSDQYRDILKQLDDLGLLLNENFERRVAHVRETILRKGVKEPFHAGNAYPADPEELRKFIEDTFEKNVEKRKASGILVPHMDLQVARSTYGKVYSRIDSDPELVVILGVSHYAHQMPMSVLPVDLKTPLGTLEVDKEAVETLKDLMDFDVTYDVLSYLREHSIEFQSIFIKYLYPNAKVLPTIISYGEPEDLRRFAQSIAEAMKGKRSLVISSVDMSHVGRKFGDSSSYDPSQRDREYLSLLSEMKNEEAYNLLKSDGNRTRIDGMYTNFVFIEMLKMLGVRGGDLVDYQIYHEAPTDSKVSYAGMIFS